MILICQEYRGSC